MKEDRDFDLSSPMVKAIKKAYKEGEEDEVLEPIIAVDSSDQPVGRLENGDYIIFYDIRGEREVELTKSLIEEEFPHFVRKKNLKLNFVTMIEYNSVLDVKVAFPPDGKIKNTFTEVVSKAGLRFCKIAESEKAIHITYFINGKNEQPFPGEERIIVPYMEVVSSYALSPEMKAKEIAMEVSSKLKDTSLQVIVVNLANVDVVGHIEDKSAVIKAVEVVDRELGKISGHCCSQGVTLVVTADHGSAEEWLYPDGTINTGHTRNLVPFILADFSLKNPNQWSLKQEGELGDIAPTLLELLKLKKPAEMTGESLLINSCINKKFKKRVLLLILDGWGIRKEKNGNMIAEAETPNFDSMWSNFPHALLKASGEAVGMPSHTVGNSEAGHLHIGAGRRVLLDRVKIDRAIENGSFFSNESFCWAMKRARSENKALHLLGIVSHYSSHGSIKHLFALLRMAKELDLKDVFIHALIGRRGERPESGAVYISKIEEMCRSLSVGKVTTVIGRFWALDREEYWDRIEKTYRALVYGDGTRVLI